MWPPSSLNSLLALGVRGPTQILSPGWGHTRNSAVSHFLGPVSTPRTMSGSLAAQSPWPPALLFLGEQSMAFLCSWGGNANILRKLTEALRDLVCVFLFDLISSRSLVCSPSPATLFSFCFSDSPKFIPTLGLFTFADPLT